MSRAALIIVLVGIAGVVNAQPDAIHSQVSEIRALVQQLEERVAALEKEVAQLKEASSESARTPAQTVTTQASRNKSPLGLTDWSYQYRTGDYGQQYYSINLKLRNSGTKGIKLIDGSVEFSDLLGETLYRIKVSPDLRIGPGEVLDDSGNYSINQFINEQLRMKDMEPNDIRAELIVRKLVFEDNSIVEYD